MKLDDKFPHHHKILALSPVAGWLWVCGIAYSNDHLTDGAIPARGLAAVAPTVRNHLRYVEELVKVGLWTVTDTGWAIHDYHDYQPTKAEAMTQKALRVAGGVARALTADRKGGKFVSSHQQNHQQPAGALLVPADQQATSPVSRIPVPVPEKQYPPKPPKGGEGPEGFQEFWRRYPKRVGKDAALRVWVKKACEGRCNDIFSGLERNMTYLLRDGGEYIPNPSTWLNQARWKDEPPVAAPADRANLDAARAFLDGRLT